MPGERQRDRGSGSRRLGSVFSFEPQINQFDGSLTSLDPLPLRRCAAPAGDDENAQLPFASLSNAISRASSASISFSGTMFGPSEGARSGASCVSMNTAGDADGHGRAGQHRHELALPAGGVALPARLLHGMGGVEDHRRACRGQIGRARMSDTSVL